VVSSFAGALHPVNAGTSIRANKTDSRVLIENSSLCKFVLYKFFQKTCNYVCVENKLLSCSYKG
ncbi:hypothetical protein P3530_27535, partial [Vibrio parahaemolyticus]|nr:hypothetical protein [Vibrio parahaemolyticus]